MGSETRPLTIRRATAADVETVARLHVESWNVAYRGIMPDDVIARTDLVWRTAFWIGRIANPEWPVLLLEENHHAVAFCHMVSTTEPGVGEIPSIHVLPGLRGRGYGRRLLDHTLAEFRRRGIAAVTLWVLKENWPARRFYERLGFHADGGARHYPNTTVPEVRYRIQLSNRASAQ